ncbi:DUF488 family protein [Promicromonospora umidemergens]
MPLTTSETSETSRSAELWTIGHWTCPEPEFLRPLDEHGIELIADVRALPGSRRTPHFDQDQMPQWLARADIGYLHLPELGGRRRKQQVDPDINAGWENASFKNYADYTLDAQYRQGVERLTKLAQDQRVAVLCGEPMPWRCHRLLIANTFAARGWTVWHLIVGASPRRHELGRWGATPSVDSETNVTYPAQDAADGR